MKEYYRVPLSYEGQDKDDWDKIIEKIDNSPDPNRSDNIPGQTEVVVQ